MLQAESSAVGLRFLVRGEMEEAPCVLHLSCAYSAVILTVLIVIFVCGVGVHHPPTHPPTLVSPQ